MPKLPPRSARPGGHPAHSGCSVPLRLRVAAAHLALVLAAPALHGGLASAVPKAACKYPPLFDAATAAGDPAVAALVGKDLVYASAAECELAAAALAAHAVAAGAPPGTVMRCAELYPGRTSLFGADCAEVALRLGTYARRVHGPEAGFLCAARGGVLHASTAGCESAAAAANTVAATPAGAA